jgi:peptidoglycan/LPS O-acetylase OafA/YrhL
MADTLIRRQNYRPEIQGIRTIGALLVACFHIWGGRVSGGVDVFFVISGFLITGSLYKEVRSSQTIDVIAFWGRIAKRIAPMAYLVLALTLLAAMLWMPQSRQAGFLSEVLYSTVHLENIKLMMNSVDYLAREEAPSPVQQFWALSVQVQFYVLWPFLLLAAGIAARRLRLTTGIYIAALAMVFLASLAYSIIETSRDPAPAYFNTFARVWEFALGGLLAIALPRLTVPPALRWLAGWTGLALVIGCGFALPASANFPGYVALWPTIGAALVLLSGGSDLGFGANRLLGSKPLVALGDISFSFYLWHWPVLIFAMLLTGRTQLSLGTGLAVIAVALCGAYLANRWIEQPIQRSSVGKSHRWHVHAMSAALAAPIVAISAIWLFANEAAESRQREAVERMASNYPGGLHPMSLATAVKRDVPVYPTPAAVKGKHPNRCQQKEKQPEILTCDYGMMEGARKTIALVGGSHAEHWLPALEKLAYEQNWKIVAITKSACPFIPNRTGNPSCVQWNRDIHDVLQKIRPDVVFTTATRRGKPTGKPNEYLPDGYLKQWEQLARNGITVIAVRDSPKMKDGVLECVEANPGDIAKCGVPRKELFHDIDPASRLSSKPDNVSFIDLTDRFCDEDLCLPVGGNVLMYRDTHHLTIQYARTLAIPLGERMRQVRPDLFLMEDRSGSRRQESLANEPK